MQESLDQLRWKKLTFGCCRWGLIRCTQYIRSLTYIYI
jgi:hypothetical protein